MIKEGGYEKEENEGTRRKKEGECGEGGKRGTKVDKECDKSNYEHRSRERERVEEKEGERDDGRKGKRRKKEGREMRRKRDRGNGGGEGKVIKIREKGEWM